MDIHAFTLHFQAPSSGQGFLPWTSQACPLPFCSLPAGQGMVICLSSQSLSKRQKMSASRGEVASWATAGTKQRVSKKKRLLLLSPCSVLRSRLTRKLDGCG
eukprot:1151750-Pelagomonas_calceolata.AAC.9